MNELVRSLSFQLCRQIPSGVSVPGHRGKTHCRLPEGREPTLAGRSEPAEKPLNQEEPTMLQGG